MDMGDFAFLTSSQVILVLLVQDHTLVLLSGKDGGNFVCHGAGLSEGTVGIFLKEESCSGTRPWRTEQNKDVCRRNKR